MRKLFTLILLTLLNSSVFSQKIVDSLINKVAEFPTERLYIEQNKTQYIAGESMIIKGFVFTGYQSSAISSNVYIELLDKEKNVFCKNVAPVYNGVFATSLQLPKELPTAVYYMRAYTRWMLNFDEQLQYVQPITIYQPGGNTGFVADTTKWSFKAIPEGGVLLNEVYSKIAVRFYDLTQNILSVKCMLWDRTNNIQIASFSPVDKNVGFCSFIPIAGHQYEIEIKDGLGQSKTQPLPEVKASGAVLNTVLKGDQLIYKVSFKNVGPNQVFKLIGVRDNEIVYKASLKNTIPIASRSLPVKEMGKGIIYFTLFDDKMNVVSERLCFLHPADATTPGINIVEQNLKPRGLNDITIKTDSAALLFASAVDRSKADGYPESTIESFFWLTGDFNDKINDAAGYFHHRSSLSNQALDILMISEKWTRFDWRKLLSNGIPKIMFEPDRYLSYNARATLSGKPLANAKLNLMIFFPDSSNQILSVQTNSDGIFILEGLLFEGRARVNYYLANDKKNNNNRLKIDIQPITISTKYTLPIQEPNLVPVTISPETSRQIDQDLNTLTNELKIKNAVKELEEVVVTAKAKTATEKLNESLTQTMFYNSREKIYDFVNKPEPNSAQNAAQWIFSRLFCSKTNPCVYFLDESPTTLEILSQIPISDIAMIKDWGRANTHQILVYLKRGGEAAVTDTASLHNNVFITGYAGIDNFISRYSIPENNRVIINDTRYNLLWTDFIFLQEGAVSEKISFLNNDHASGIKISVTGITTSGKPFYIEKSIQ